MLIKIRYPLFDTLLIIISRPYEQMCPGVIVHPFSGIIAWTGYSTDQYLSSSAWADILCVTHILVGISSPELFTWSSGWSFLLILQQGQSLWFLSGWFQVLLKLSCFFIACKTCLQNISKLYVILNPGYRAKFDKNPELLWCQPLTIFFPLTVKP